MDKFLRLHQELHARPLPEIRAGSTVFHLAKFRGDDSVEREKQHLKDLAQIVAAVTQTSGEEHLLLLIGDNSLRVEFHTEFTEYTFIKNTLTEFGTKPTTDTIPEEWIQGIPGETINRLRMRIEPVAEYCSTTEAEETFGADSLIASDISDDQVRIWSDFRISSNGNTRILFQCKTGDDARIGRAIQRIIDIENYRLLAFIGLQKAREIAKPMGEVESRLKDVMKGFKDIDSLEQEKETLAGLIDLSADVELMKANAMRRFQATEAYSEIMIERLNELRETKIEGCLSISGFLLRRSTPAFRTCKAVRNRISELSLRVSRAAELLRTRINVQIEEQNQQLLRSVDRRASLQNRLQLTIEWFSIVAISVYILQLIRILLDAGKELAPGLNTALDLGIMTPLVLLVMAFAITKIRKRYNE